jgi:hypothetical protein
VEKSDILETTEKLLNSAVKAGFIKKNDETDQYEVVNQVKFSKHMSDLLEMASETIYGFATPTTKDAIQRSFINVGITHPMAIFISLMSDKGDKFRTTTKIVNSNTI